jgi:hypothetical protein
MKRTSARRTVSRMRGTIAVLWKLNGKVHSGSLELLDDRLELRTRSRTLGIPLNSIVHYGIERGAAARLKGLVVLRLDLSDGVVVRVASLQGMGVLHQLAGRLAPSAVAASGT